MTDLQYRSNHEHVSNIDSSLGSTKTFKNIVTATSAL